VPEGVTGGNEKNTEKKKKTAPKGGFSKGSIWFKIGKFAG